MEVVRRLSTEKASLRDGFFGSRSNQHRPKDRKPSWEWSVFLIRFDPDTAIIRKLEGIVLLIESLLTFEPRPDIVCVESCVFV